MSENINKSVSEQDVRFCAFFRIVGLTTPSLRAVSVELNDYEISFKCYFDYSATEEDIMLMGEASTLIISDYNEPFTINDEYLEIDCSKKMDHLRWVVYCRYEEKPNKVVN